MSLTDVYCSLCFEPGAHWRPIGAVYACEDCETKYPMLCESCGIGRATEERFGFFVCGACA